MRERGGAMARSRFPAMKIYLAGLYTSNFDMHGRLFLRLTEKEKADRRAVRHYLESYHYVKRGSYVERMRRDGVTVFLDSGAYSAFTKGVEVDLDAYCEYIKRNADIIERVDGVAYASVLDGIGNPRLTYDNQKKMEEAGATPLPCFHYGEDERYLEYYLDNYRYITLGGMVPIGKPQCRLWLDRIFEKYIVDANGRPKVKVHGFGLNTFSFMLRYPWYSVDASSWVQHAAMGNIILPWEDGILYFPISDFSSSIHKHNAHFNTIPAQARERMVWEVERRGYTVADVQTKYLSRWIFNIAAFREIQDQLFNKEKTFLPESYGIF